MQNYKTSCKYIGRPASVCKKCRGRLHFVNRLGGIQCEQCSPAKKDGDIVLRLEIESGKWVSTDSLGSFADQHVNQTYPIAATLETSDPHIDRLSVEALGDQLKDRSRNCADVSATVSANSNSLPNKEIEIKEDKQVEIKARELPTRETDRFGSNELWDRAASQVMDATIVRSTAKPASASGGEKTVELPTVELPAIGQTITLPRRIPLFGRHLEAGTELIVSAAGRDATGAAIVDLSEVSTGEKSTGRLLVSGFCL